MSSKIVVDGLPNGPSTPALLVTLRYMRDPYKFYREQFKKFGSPFLVKTLRGPLVVVADPDQAKQVFTANPDELETWGADALDAIVGPASLLLVSGARHRRDRKLLTPPFHGARMKAYGEVMREAARREAARWSDGQQLQMLHSAQAISLEVILRAVFGVQSDGDVAKWSHAITNMMESGHPAGIFFRAARVAPLGLGPWGKFVKARTVLDQMIYEEIKDRRANHRMGEDILSMMMQAKYDDGGSMPDAELRDELVTLLLAGHETTAITMSWAIYWLHSHPASLRKLQLELDGLIEAGTFGSDQIYALPWLDAVCNETLRLHPIVVDVVRTTKVPLEVGGFRVPANTPVAVSVSTIHEREDLYDRPGEFRPQRFIERKYSPFEHLPFGGGHRRCLGAAFAMYEMKLVLAELLSAHRFKVIGQEQVGRRGITMGPVNGVAVRYLGARKAPTLKATA